MILAIIGSRTFTDYSLLVQKVKELIPFPTIDLIVSGGAKGTDTLAEKFATDHNIPIQRILPDWNKYGKAAGVIRNTDIINKADIVLAMWDGNSRGTRDGIYKAKKAGKQIHVIEYLKEGVRS